VNEKRNISNEWKQTMKRKAKNEGTKKKQGETEAEREKDTRNTRKWSTL
jgi:hypothetical protein